MHPPRIVAVAGRASVTVERQARHNADGWVSTHTICAGGESLGRG
jgi:hypothetical protein